MKQPTSIKLKIKEKLVNKHELLEKIGFDAQQFCARSFRRQGLYKDNAWPARVAPSLAGIFADANEPGNGAIKTRRLDTRPALIDKGRLSRSITYQVEGNKVVVGTNVPYAKIHNEGGTSTQLRHNYESFDQKIDKFVRVDMKDFGDDAKMNVLGLKKADSLTTKVPKRQFLGYPTKRAWKIIKEHLDGNPHNS